jgi:hypothetical protein
MAKIYLPKMKEILEKEVESFIQFIKETGTDRPDSKKHLLLDFMMWCMENNPISLFDVRLQYLMISLDYFCPKCGGGGTVIDEERLLISCENPSCSFQNEDLFKWMLYKEEAILHKKGYDDD